MTHKNTYVLKNLLNQCRLIKQKDDAISKATGYNFNIFSILDRERYEVTTHSYFIFELLNPKGSHNQKTKFLEIFLIYVLGIKNYGNISNFYVERESLTQKNRRIDFTIECDNLIIGIEMKIDAGDQKNQLFDYDAELKYRAKGKKDIFLYYLTLDGSDASEYSLNGLSKDTVHNLSFNKDIYLWIKMCMESVVSIPILRDALNQYLILIEKITGKKESIVDEISDLLLKDDNLAVAIELEKSVTKAKVKIQHRFWKLFLEKLPSNFEFIDFDFIATDLDGKVDKYYELSNSYRYYGVKYDISTTKDYTISYYIELHNKLYHGLTVSKQNEKGMLERADYSDEDIYFAIRNTLLEKNIFVYQSAWWIARKHFDCSPEIDFYNFNTYTLQLNDNSILEQSVECLVAETIESLKKVKVLFPEMTITL